VQQDRKEDDENVRYWRERRSRENGDARPLLLNLHKPDTIKAETSGFWLWP